MLKKHDVSLCVRQDLVNGWPDYYNIVGQVMVLTILRKTGLVAYPSIKFNLQNYSYRIRL